MLALTNIAIRRGRNVLIEGASMQVHAGQRVGVIGANGCGKSSLFAMIMGELEADDGELSLDEKDVIAHVAQESPHGSGSAVDHVMDGDQELREVQAAIAKGEADETRPDLHLLYERMEAIDGFTAESRASRLLHGLGFAADEFTKPVKEFSGGWRMRLNLARALMCRSDLLLLDEPTNHLDLPAILWLERWLKRYEGILLVVSHDRDFLDQVCTRIAHIEHKAMKLYTGTYSQFEALRAEHLALEQAMFARQQNRSNIFRAMWIGFGTKRPRHARRKAESKCSNAWRRLRRRTLTHRFGFISSSPSGSHNICLALRTQPLATVTKSFSTIST